MRAALARENGHELGLAGVGVDVGEHGVGIGDLEGVALDLGLDEHLLDDPVAYQHRVAPRTLAEAQVFLVDQHAHAVAEGAVAVGDDGDVLRLLIRLPGVHDEGVVDRDAEDAVDAVVPEHPGQLVVARQMRRRTGWREGARQREDDDRLSREQLPGGDVHPLAALLDPEGDVWNPLSFTVLQHWPVLLGLPVLFVMTYPAAEYRAQFPDRRKRRNQGPGGYCVVTVVERPRATSCRPRVKEEIPDERSMITGLA